MSWGNWRNRNISKKRNKSNNKLPLFIVNSIVVFIIFVIALLIFLLPYEVLMERFVIMLFIFFLISIVYFGVFADKEDRITLINMWKIYIPSIFIISTLIYSIEMKNFDVKSDYLKTKLNYNLSMQNNDINSSFNEYSNYIENHLKIYEAEKLDSISALTDKYVLVSTVPEKKLKKEDKEKKEYYFLWYINFLFGLLNILTVFMFLLYFKDLKIKENILNTFGIK